jgi:hypothetical protein
MSQITYMKLLKICFVSSFVRELAKLMKEQYNATQAHHLSYKIRLHD